MKEKAPAYQRYPKQILGDDKYLAMEWDARGMHNWLLDISWQQEPRGTIPADQAVLRRWLGSPSDDIWRRVWPQISPAWPAYLDGRLGNKGMLRTAEKQENYSRGNSNKGANKTQIPRKPLEDEDENVVSITQRTEKPEENFNGEMWVNAILSAHPKPEWGQAAQSYVIDAITAEAKSRKWNEKQAAEYIQARTQLFAQCVDRWPGGDKKFLEGGTKFFEKRLYNQPEKAWERSNGKSTRYDEQRENLKRVFRDAD